MHDASRVVTAGAWVTFLTLFLTPFAIPAIILGAIAVQKRRVLAGTVIMCLATLAVVASFLLYSYAVLDAIDSGSDDLLEGIYEDTSGSGESVTGEHDDYSECLADPDTTVDDCDSEFP